MLKKYFFLFILFLSLSVNGQNAIETQPPYHIKTISFLVNNQNVMPIFRLGDNFDFIFDDLHATEDDYYYEINHYNYNWTPSDLTKNEYIGGVDNQRILDYRNSLNALQLYSHYRLSFPNKFTQITKSGNYLISIFDNNHELVFSKSFIVYEYLADVPMQVKRARNVSDAASKHNLDFTIKSKNILFQNPQVNLKVVLLQNNKWNNAIYNVKPQYTIGNDLIFKYDQETQFYAGNEYYFFDTKEIMAANNSVARITSNGGLYNSLLYTNTARKNNIYTFFPDVNGNFQVRNLRAENSEIEADYSWVYFVLFAPDVSQNSNIYVTGMFNNNVTNAENKMDYNKTKGVFEKAILIKQGFVNYRYTKLDDQNQVREKDNIDGNFFQTENDYTALVYYRANGERYDRIVGKGNCNSVNIIN
jgi:Domain of unknown function (DUF5103)